MDLTKYGYNVVIEQSKLSVVEASCLQDILRLRDQLDMQWGFWSATNARATISATSEARAVVTSLEQAITATSYRAERTAYAFYKRFFFLDLIKAFSFSSF